jgi:NADH-quinone oxidoreductase subunit H
MRSVAQIVSYEIPTGLAVLAVVMIAGSLNLQEIVAAQNGWFWNWFLFQKFPFVFMAFLIYFVGSLAETNRVPFDIPEAESELVAGYMTEYSGMRFAFFYLAEYANMFAVAAIGSTLFFGGWQSPFGDFLSGPIWGVFWFISKGMFVVFVQMWLRWTLPRLRVDQLMYMCWKVLTPLAFLNIAGVGLWVLLAK